MHTGEVVHLFQGKRGNRSTKRKGSPSALRAVWTRVTSFAAAVAEVARESRELEQRLLKERGYRRFTDG